MAQPSPTEPDGPIVDIFKSLIKNDTPRNIVLTNSHLNNILQKEFYMDTALMQKFEVEMYINVLKKYLKNWPKWDTFGQTLDKLKEEKDQEGITKILKLKYVEIKEYLSGMLDIAQELASDKVQELNMLKEKKGKDVIMEVDGTAEQLRSLFYMCPLNGSIFNLNPSCLTGPIPRRFTFESIVNWFGVEIEMTASVNKKILTYRRQNLHKLTHRLLNKKLKEQEPCQPELNSSILVTSRNSPVNVSRDDLMKLFRQSLNSKENNKWRSVFGEIEKIIDDLRHLPEFIDISCNYRRHTSEQKYVRYFSRELLEGDDTNKYDLHLEEVVSPLCEYSFKVIDDGDNFGGASFTLTCAYCQILFIGPGCVGDILKHFSIAHMTEADWKCLKCCKDYTMCYLTKTAWTHPCNGSIFF